MKHSIEIKILVIFTVIMALIVSALILIEKKGVSWAVNKYYDDLGEMAAESASLLMDGKVELSESEQVEIKSRLSKLVQREGLAYLYVFVPDLKTGEATVVAVAENEKYTNIMDRKVFAYGYRRKMVAFEHIKSVWIEKKQVDSRTFDLNGYDFTDYSVLVRNASNEKVAVATAGVETALLKDRARKFTQIAIVAVVGMYMIAVLLMLFMLRINIFKPLKQLNASIRSFTSEDTLNYEPLPVKGKDEFATITTSFNDMKQDLKQHVNQVKELSEEKSRQEAELDIAFRIQQEMLPGNHMKTNGVEIWASMDPARQVGGDFYHYIDLGNGKICMLIADVSGKGTTAALFMARAITLLQETAKQQLSPANMLERVNDALAYQNAQSLFVTSFVAIYDTKDQSLTYSNAGHNVPYLFSDSWVKELDEARGMAIGLFEGETYEESQLKLDDSVYLYLYTDGVNEAVSNEKKLFGNARIEEAIEGLKKGDIEADQFVDYMNDAIFQFANGEQQSDDITMLFASLSKGV